MPRRIQFEDDAEIQRRGNTDYLWTAVGWRGIRTFNGAEGRWRLSNLGKRYFKRNAGLPEVVLRIPCIFETQKTTERSVRHLGWFPYELMDESLRARLTRLFLPGPHAPDRAARIQALKDEILTNLEIRRDAATGMIVLHFESDQIVLLDEHSGREWEWSALATRVDGMRYS